jgi:host cell surface-exposed lipoprotein
MIEAPPNPISPQRSADGLWEWNGTQWIAAQPPPGAQQVAQSVPVGQFPPQVPVKKKGHLLRNVGIVVGALLLVGIGAALASSPSAQQQARQGTSDAFNSPAATAQAPATAKPTAAATAKASPIAPAGPTLTNQQQNAAESARQYLDMQAFSRLGLIDQLSSSYGEGYSVRDSTIAVDSLHVNWNAEAVQSAKEYLATQPFSCKGLIAQLDSRYGERFTVAQATYGAQQAGAC